MPPTASVAATVKVSRTRWPSRAPKFCPATGATAKPERDDRHEAGLDHPLADAEPGLRRGAERPAHGVDDAHVDGDQPELDAGRQADAEQALPRRPDRARISWRRKWRNDPGRST